MSSTTFQLCNSVIVNDVPVSSWRDEIKAAVDSGVRYHLLPVNAHLLIEVFVKLLVEVFNYRHPATSTQTRSLQYIGY